MFSVDDSFELSEEDFLQAALCVENASQVTECNRKPPGNDNGSTPDWQNRAGTGGPCGVGSQETMDFSSQSQSPVISLVGPCDRMAGGNASVNTTKSSPVSAANKSSPETGSSVTRRFNFKRSPYSASPAPGSSSGFASSSQPLNDSPTSNIVSAAFNKVTGSNVQSGPVSTRPPLTSAGQSKSESHPGVSKNGLFVVSQDSCDSDLDLSLDSDPLKMFACKTPVKRMENSAAAEQLPPTSWSSTINVGNASSPVHNAKHSKNSDQTARVVQQDTVTSSLMSEVVFKTPQSSPALSRLRTFHSTTSGAMDTPTTSRPAVFKTPPGDSSGKLPSNRPGQDWDTPSSNISSASSATSLASSIGKRKRKFPGPAGLLPKLKRGMSLEDASKFQSPEVPTSPATPKESTPDLPSSQSSEDGFFDGPWKMMKEDLEPQANTILEEFSVSSIHKKAAKKLLPKGKVPVVCALVDSVSNVSDDASVVLKDRTGNIKGTLHRQLMKDHMAEMIPGTVLVLRQVGVFSPSNRSHYLNITPNNIVRIYTKAESGSVTKCKLSEFSADDYVIPELCPPSTLLSDDMAPWSPGPGGSGPIGLGGQGPGPRTNFRPAPSPGARATFRPGSNQGPQAPFRPGQGNPRPGSNSSPRYQFRPRMSGSPANSGSPLYGSHPNVPVREMPGERSIRTPTSYNTRPFAPQTRPHVNSTGFQVQQISASSHQNVNLPWQKKVSNEALNPQGKQSVKPGTTSSVPGKASSGTASQLYNNDNSGYQEATTAKESVEDLWQDNDEQLDDLLTGIGDELFDDF